MTPIIDLELGGFSVDDAGSVPFEEWHRPRSVTLEAGAICGDEFHGQHVGIRVRHERGLVLKFSQIDSPEAALAFAKRWGLLGLCRKHLRPVQHSGSDAGLGLQQPPELLAKVGWDGPLMREPVERWLHYARWFRGMLQVAAATAAGSTVPREAAYAALELPEDTKYPVVVAGAVGRTTRDAYQLLGDWPDFVANQITEMLWLTRIHPSLSWFKRSTPKMVLASRYATLMAALVVDLAFTVCQQDALYACNGCGGILDSGRKPIAGKRAFCSKCKAAGVDRRLATRDCRARQRSGQSATNSTRSGSKKGKS